MTHPPAAPSVHSQESFWNRWNTEAREDKPLDRESARRGEWAERQLRSLGLTNPRIIDIGCGTGWLSARLATYGKVVATDLAGDVIERARERHPDVEFIAGDFNSLGFGEESFDVAVCLETLSHVPDQQGFIDSIGRLLKPGGHLILTTQNRTVMSRLDVPPPGVGQIRNWLTPKQARQLFGPRFKMVSATTINAPGYQRLRKHAFLPSGILTGLAERAGLGKTIVLVARAKHSGE